MPTTEDDATDSLVIVLEPRRRIELNELTDSFAGLSTFYDNNFGSDKSQKLIVSDLKTKCIYLELIPYSIILGGLITSFGKRNDGCRLCSEILFSAKGFR